jgi:hypothetical protein
MRIFEVYDEKIPQWALPALVNGDLSGLDEDDIKLVMEFSEKYPKSILDITQFGERGEDLSDGYFSLHPAFGLPCMVNDCTILKISD